MSYNAKNYTEQGGDVTRFGGKVVFEESCEVEGLAADPLQKASADTLGGIKVGDGLSIDSDGVLSTDPIEAATTETLGGVIVGSGLSIDSDGVLSADGITPAENQEDSEASTVATLKEDFNALLAKLKTAGLMEPDEE